MLSKTAEEDTEHPLALLQNRFLNSLLQQQNPALDVPLNPFGVVVHTCDVDRWPVLQSPYPRERRLKKETPLPPLFLHTPPTLSCAGVLSRSAWEAPATRLRATRAARRTPRTGCASGPCPRGKGTSDRGNSATTSCRDSASRRGKSRKCGTAPNHFVGETPRIAQVWYV